MFDYHGKYIGVTGVGITVHDVQKLLDHYQKRYQRNVYFIDQSGEVVLSGDQSKPIGLNVNTLEGLQHLSGLLTHQTGGSAQYTANHLDYLVNIRYVPELKWYLVVEKNEADATADIRQTLYLNLALCAVVTMLVLWLTQMIVRRYQHKIERLSTLDRLTGLPNRAAFDAVMGLYVNDAKRQIKPLSLLILDIDFFKKINDSYGHLAGDYALQRVAEILKKPRRATDFVCRWGGEEFLVVLKECPQAEAVMIAESIRCAVAEQVAVYQTHRFGLTLSAGVATLQVTEDLEQWLSRADQYLYEAKRLGRNRVVSEMT
jgi:diguanylate cyclase (GGDEF)-like protein